MTGGYSNDVNLNKGNDSANLYDGGGRVRGGSDSDILNVVDGFWDVVNGNKGDDYLTNYSYAGGTLRGGARNDILVDAGGGADFYGDLGADTFRPYALESSGIPVKGHMVIKDFQPGIDSLDLSAIGGANYVYIDGSTFIGSLSTGELVAVVENVFL